MGAEEQGWYAQYLDDFGPAAMAEPVGYLAFAQQAYEATRVGGVLDLAGIEQMRSSSVFQARSRCVPHCPTTISAAEDLGDAYAAMFNEEDGCRRFLRAVYLQQSAAKICMEAHVASGRLFPARVLDPTLQKVHRRWLGFRGDKAAGKVMTILRDLACAPMLQAERELVREAADILEGGMFTEEFCDHILEGGPTPSRTDRSRWRIIDDLVDIIDGEASADDPAMQTMLDYLHAEVLDLTGPVTVRGGLIGRGLIAFRR